MGNNLKRAFEAESVAIVGASRDSAKFSNWVLQALRRNSYQGKVYPINASADEIVGYKAYSKLSEIEGKIELVCIALPASMVSDALRECVELKIPAVIVFASGFGEMGEEGKRMEAELLDIIKGSSTRLMGPNSLGVINTKNRLIANFGREIVQREHPFGNIAFLSQSGAFGQALLCWAQDNNLGLSKFVSTGNEVDVDCADYLEYLAEDEDTKAIMMYIEGLKRGKEFISAAKKVTSKKPVLVLKVGRTSSGQRAASSHTGALVGQDEIYDAAFKQAGIIRVCDAEEMFDVARALTNQPLLQGNRVAIITSSGGIGVETSDACELGGLEVPAFSEKFIQKLRQELPEFAGVANPIDLTSQVHLHPYWFRDCIKWLVESEEVDGVIVGVSAFRQVEIAENILEGVRGSQKPVLVSWTIGKAAEEAIKVLENDRVPVYPTPERAARAMSWLFKYSQYLKKVQLREKMNLKGDGFE